MWLVYGIPAFETFHANSGIPVQVKVYIIVYFSSAFPKVVRKAFYYRKRNATFIFDFWNFEADCIISAIIDLDLKNVYNSKFLVKNY